MCVWGGGGRQVTLLVVVSLSKTTGCFRSCRRSGCPSAMWEPAETDAVVRETMTFTCPCLEGLNREGVEGGGGEHTSPQLACQARSLDTTLSLSRVSRRPCECDPSGSVGDCSPSDGGCHCKASVEGQSCSRSVKPLLGISVHISLFFFFFLIIVSN